VSDILAHLWFAAQSRPFLTRAQIEHRAKLVEADFGAAELHYHLGHETYLVEGIPLPYAFYRLPGSDCDVAHAEMGDRRHRAMSGGGLDRECLLYYSKISEWAHDHIPHLWPARLRDGLREPTMHIDTLCEVWWLSRVRGAEFKTARHAAPVDPSLGKGKNCDWQVRLASGLTLNLEVKRRPGDIGRIIDELRLKPRSLFDAVDKFGTAPPPQTRNVGCIRLFGPITAELRAAAQAWLAVTPAISGLALCALTAPPGENFALISQPGVTDLAGLFSPPDREDLTYLAPVSYALTSAQVRARYPGVHLPGMED
jgi:hypothetical protein